MKACSVCGTLPVVKKVKGNIHPTYIKLQCPKCKKETGCVKDDFGAGGNGPDAVAVIKEDWAKIN